MDFDPFYGAGFTRALGALNVTLGVLNHLPAAAPYAPWVQRGIALVFGGAVQQHAMEGHAAGKFAMPLLLVATTVAVPYLTTKGDVTAAGASVAAAAAGYVIGMLWAKPPAKMQA